MSGHDAAPVAPAIVSVMGQDFAVDAAGRVAVPYGLYPWTPLVVRAPGFFPRATLVRWDRTLSLWPAGALPVKYVGGVVYGGGRTLVKPAAPEVLVVPVGALAHDARCHEAIDEAAAQVAEASGARVMRSAQGDPAAVVVEVTIAPNDAHLTQGGIAVFYRTRKGYAIEGARLVVASAEAARRVPLLTHELGHLWLWHSDDPRDLMHGTASLHEVRRFSSRERDALRLVAARPAGNLFEDDDRHLGPYADLVSIGLMHHSVVPESSARAVARVQDETGPTVLTCV